MTSSITHIERSVSIEIEIGERSQSHGFDEVHA